MANVNKYYKTAFAENGSRLDVPDESISGAVAFNSGFGSDYELPQGDPSRKRIERDKFNDLIYGITKNIKQIQERSFPTWIEDRGDGDPFFYSRGAIVYHQSDYYVSNAAFNTGIPGADSRWEKLDFLDLVEQATESKAGIAEIATQSEVNAGTDNSRFVTPLKLKSALTSNIPIATESISGVVRVATQAEVDEGSNAKRMVTPLTLSKALPFEKSSVQSSPSKVADVVYTNTTGKPLQVNILVRFSDGTGTNPGQFRIQGFTTINLGTPAQPEITTICSIVPPGQTYELVTSGSNWTRTWWAELIG